MKFVLDVSYPSLCILFNRPHILSPNLLYFSIYFHFSYCLSNLE